MKKFNKAYLEITNRCNLSCSFCPKTKRELRNMSLAEFKIAVDEISKVTKYIYFHVLGEPTLHPDLPAFVEYANSLGMKITITTNGTLVEKLSEIAENHNLYKVNFSLQAVGANDSINLTSYMEKVLQFSKVATEKGTLVVLRLWNNGSKINRNQEIVEVLKTNFGEFEYKDSGSVTLLPKLYLERADEFLWKCSDEVENLYCYGLKDQFGVLVDGTVIPCCIDSEGEIPLGNIFKNKLLTILESEKSEMVTCGFQKKKAVESRCKRCGFARRFKV